MVVMTRAVLSGPRSVAAVQPWEPVSTADSQLPDRVTPDWLAQRFTQDPDALATLLRAHLVPAKKKSDVRYAAQFRALWRSVGFLDRRLRSRVLELLQGWRDDAVAALSGDTDLSADDRRAITFFSRDVEGAINRVHREIAEPMSWAGNEFANFPPAARAVIESLVIAIDEFDQGALTQRELVGMLACLGVDPAVIAERRDTEIPEEARQRVIEAAKLGGRGEIHR
jgi:hypothetical protein